MNNKIHIWDLPVDKIYVKLDEIRNELIDKAIEKADKIIEGKTRRKAYKLTRILSDISVKYAVKKLETSRIIFHWKKGDCFIPLWAVIEMVKFVDDHNISIKKIEQRITYYKSRGSSYVIKANLPLKTNPEMVAIYFHLFGDGCFSEDNSTAVYCQLDKETRNTFIQKLKNAFGEFDSSKLKHSKYTFIFPSVFAHITKYIFDANTFLSNKARIPEKIKKLPYILKFSGVVAFLLDEGNIDGYIAFASHNKLFLEDFREFLFGMGFGSRIRGNILALKNKHVLKFYEDYLTLIFISPCCNLTFKEDRLKMLVNINRANGKHSLNKEEIIPFKQKIKIILDEGGLRTNQIREVLFRKYQKVLSYNVILKILKIMEEGGIVERTKITKRVIGWSDTSL